MKLSRMNHRAYWFELVGRYEELMRSDQDLRWPGHNPHQAELQALGYYKLSCFAERIAKDPRAAWSHLTTTQALNLYLLNKHHWSPDQSANMTEDDYLFLLRDELMQMKLTAEESAPIRSTLAHSPSALRELEGHLD
ncbi:hypothetical protein HFV04_016755 [Pseudomonas sp. BIGb0427]|uniref:hypothetical protein n=1 Tax=Pseudomonas sp. BIGb0427 TaxID=2724470 RepID=UPI0018A6F5AF|nr:hypothetical protein [Pseudomonas sp. BIGb0427]QPG61177.1 hypothetical protein HFV04_016755 [Pseudomonas sp. BIGb0427]